MMEIVNYILRMPWNQETKIGYFAEIIHSIVVTVYYFLCNGAFLLTFIGLCLHNQAFYQIFKYTLRHHNLDNRESDANFIRHLVSFHILKSK